MGDFFFLWCNAELKIHWQLSINIFTKIYKFKKGCEQSKTKYNEKLKFISFNEASLKTKK